MSHPSISMKRFGMKMAVMVINATPGDRFIVQQRVRHGSQVVDTDFMPEGKPVYIGLSDGAEVTPNYMVLDMPGEYVFVPDGTVTAGTSIAVISEAEVHNNGKI